MIFQLIHCLYVSNLTYSRLDLIFGSVLDSSRKLQFFRDHNPTAVEKARETLLDAVCFILSTKIYFIDSS